MNQTVEIVLTLAIIIILLFIIGFCLKIILDTIINAILRNGAYKLLEKGQKQKTLDENEVYLIFKQEIQKNVSQVSYVDFLEDFLIYIRKKDQDGKLTTDFNALLEPIIEHEKENQPYSNVEEMERRSMLAIENAALNNEKSSIKKNLEDLSIMIEKKQKTLASAKRQNRISLCTSILGIVLSIFFWLYGSSLSEDNVKNISKQISEQICKTTKDLEDK